MVRNILQCNRRSRPTFRFRAMATLHSNMQTVSTMTTDSPRKRAFSLPLAKKICLASLDLSTLPGLASLALAAGPRKCAYCYSLRGNIAFAQWRDVIVRNAIPSKLGHYRFHAMARLKCRVMLFQLKLGMITRYHHHQSYTQTPPTSERVGLHTGRYYGEIFGKRLSLKYLSIHKGEQHG